MKVLETKNTDRRKSKSKKIRKTIHLHDSRAGRRGVANAVRFGSLNLMKCSALAGGRCRARTDDLLVVSQLLYQLS
jgi:hypothetical protein